MDNKIFGSIKETEKGGIKLRWILEIELVIFV